jgi:hypothetical protein
LGIECLRYRVWMDVSFRESVSHFYLPAHLRKTLTIPRT